MPDPTAFATREQLLTTQREVLAELERTWRLRRTVPATLWMVGVTFALLLVLAAVDAVGRRGASGVVVLVLVGVPALLLLWRGLGLRLPLRLLLRGLLERERER